MKFIRLLLIVCVAFFECSFTGCTKKSKSLIPFKASLSEIELNLPIGGRLVNEEVIKDGFFAWYKSREYKLDEGVIKIITKNNEAFAFYRILSIDLIPKAFKEKITLRAGNRREVSPFTYINILDVSILAGMGTEAGAEFLKSLDIAAIDGLILTMLSYYMEGEVKTEELPTLKGIAIVLEPDLENMRFSFCYFPVNTWNQIKLNKIRSEK